MRITRALSSAEEGSPLLGRPLARETPRGTSRKVWVAALALVALVSCGVAAATTTTWARGGVGDISAAGAPRPGVVVDSAATAAPAAGARIQSRTSTTVNDRMRRDERVDPRGSVTETFRERDMDMDPRRAESRKRENPRIEDPREDMARMRLSGTSVNQPERASRASSTGAKSTRTNDRTRRDERVDPLEETFRERDMDVDSRRAESRKRENPERENPREDMARMRLSGTSVNQRERASSTRTRSAEDATIRTRDEHDGATSVNQRERASSTRTRSAVDAALRAVNAHRANAEETSSSPRNLSPDEIAAAVKDANDAVEASIAKNRTAAAYKAANVNREWSSTFYKMEKATNETRNACVVASRRGGGGDDADMACDASTAALYEATTSSPRREALFDADVAEKRKRRRADIRAKRKHKRAMNALFKNDDGTVTNLGAPYVPLPREDAPRLGKLSLDGITSLFEGATGAWGDATHVAGLVQDGGFSFFSDSDDGVAEGSGFCWKETYPRDAGTLPQHCEDHQEIIAGGVYCYDKCESGWERFGYDCHKSCPSGWDDHGLLCNNPSAVYSRAHSPGCQWVSSTSYWPHWAGLECGGSICSSQNKEDIAGQCYEYCPSGYDTIGFLCSANCQALGFEGGLAPSCTQHVKLSPGMTKAQCAPGYEEDAGLCYKQCPDGMDGVGPVCWGGPPIVNGAQWVDCGMGAAADDFTCASVTADQVISVGETILFFATLGSSSAATVPAKVGIDAGQKAISVAGDTAKAIKNVAETAKDVYDTSTDILGALDAMASIETEADGIRAAAEVASLVDPTGLSSVVAAYAHDICTRFTGDSDEEMSFDEQSAIATENAKKEHYEEKALESVKTCYWTDAKTVTATSQCAHDAYESAGGDAADAAELRDEMRELLRRSDDEGARFGALPKTTVTASGASFACDDASDFIVDEVEMFGKWIAGSGASYAKKKTTSASGGLVVALNATKEEEEGDESSSSSRRYVVSHHAGDRCKMVRFSISRASGTCAYAADEAGITIGGTHDCETAEGVAAAWDARQSRTLASTATAKGFGVGALKGYMPNVASK
jgi:hypothetical protein